MAEMSEMGKCPSLQEWVNGRMDFGGMEECVDHIPAFPPFPRDPLNHSPIRALAVISAISDISAISAIAGDGPARPTFPCAGRWVEQAGERERCFYRLTATGKRILAEQRATWQAFVAVVDDILKASDA
jgi:hypothetical protein